MSVVDVQSAADTATAATDYVSIAREMRPRLEERAPWADRERRLPEETVRELIDAGMFKLTMPKSCGGAGLTMADYSDVQFELGKGCLSTAWVQMIIGCVNHVAMMSLGDEGRAHVLGSVEDLRMCSVLAAKGSAKRVEGGWVVNGKWPSASGSLHSNWGMVGCLLQERDGNPAGVGSAFMPISDDDGIQIMETWFVTGMRGTGSNMIVAEDVFVPDHLIALQSEIAEKEFWGPDTEPAERWEFAPQFGLGLMGPALGGAEALFEGVAANMGKRGVAEFDFPRQVDSSVVLGQLGEARMLLDSARLQTRRGIAALEETTLQRPMTYNERARCRADAGFAASQVRAGMSALLDIAGSAMFSETAPLERIWRDLSVVTRHPMLNTKLTNEILGRALSDQPNITHFV
ncbi:acyl-CoA dehydrogenase family protein [Mycolicibacterium stellerae]|uniref:acyl-CoA dehydrogenase family protein n=1 Tax=Mycolicibacterium stellerae TaxID=2358193 RepID=UPI0013DDA0BA|nr:acyl-CoA dehydrogenase family protein [Mycolicibacterium stellerae]